MGANSGNSNQQAVEVKTRTFLAKLRPVAKEIRWDQAAEDTPSDLAPRISQSEQLVPWDLAPVTDDLTLHTIGLLAAL